MGHTVSIICQKKDLNETNYEIVNGVSIYRIFYGLESRAEQSKKSGFVLKLLQKIRFIKNLPFFPITNLSYARSIYKTAINIHKTNPVDVFVSVTQLVDHIHSGILFKKKNPSTKIFIYSLDALSSGYVSNLKKYKRYFQSKMKKYEISALKQCDFFFAMESHKSYIANNDFYKPFTDKIIYTDIPLYIPRDQSLVKEKKEPKKIVYTGNMTYLDSKFIKRLASSLNNFDFLFVGNHAYTFAKELEKCNNIKVMGPVSHDKILSTQNSAAYLLAFDTASSSMIPGKIFEYFSAKKPVIFCSMNQQCSYINYLDKYENYIFIRTDYDEEKIVEVFSSFIQSNGNDADEAFAKNTPYFTATLFEKYSIF